MTNYTITSLNGIANFTFLVNTTKPGNYSFRSQCESSTTSPLQANSSDSPSYIYVNQAFGYLSAFLERPLAGVNTNVIQNYTFLLMINVTCASANPTAVCDQVNATALYNISTEPGTQINTTEGDVPFFSFTDNQTCGQMNATDFCYLNWTVNATGAIGSRWKMGALFKSNNSGVLQNTTANATITINGCSVDFTLQWSSVDFGNLNPSTTGNPAPGNSNNLYNISTNPGSCDIDFYIRGGNLTNTTFNSMISTGNISWNNASNSFSSAFHLSDDNVAIQKRVKESANITTWYWLNAPPVFAGLYNGSIFITGVISGQQAP